MHCESGWWRASQRSLHVLIRLSSFQRRGRESYLPLSKDTEKRRLLSNIWDAVYHVFLTSGATLTEHPASAAIASKFKYSYLYSSLRMFIFSWYWDGPTEYWLQFPTAHAERLQYDSLYWCFVSIRYLPINWMKRHSIPPFFADPCSTTGFWPSRWPLLYKPVSRH